MTLIDEQEAKLYDRQIRLWGLNAQQRIKSHSVFVNKLNSTTTEILKNLVLAGIKAITLVLDVNTTRNSFLIKENSENELEQLKIKLSDLNPRVKVDVINDQDNSEKYLQTADTIILFERILCWKQKFELFHGKYPNANVILCSCAGLQAFAHFFFANYSYSTDETNSSAVLVENFYYIDEFINFDPSNFIKSCKRQAKIPVGLFIAKMFIETSKPNITLADWEAYSTKYSLDKNLIDEKVIDSLQYEDDISMGAIFGGFISQVVLKSMSRDKPLGGNVFFFNGVDCSGQFDWYPSQDESQTKPSSMEIVVDEIL